MLSVTFEEEKLFSPPQPAPTPATHFDSSHFDQVGNIRKQLRPFLMAGDPNTGSIYFNVLSSPNLTAYMNLSTEKNETLEDLEKKYLKPSEYGYRRIPASAEVEPGSAPDLANSIWLLKKRPFAASLKYEPKPFYTNPTAQVITLVINNGIVMALLCASLFVSIRLHLQRYRCTLADYIIFAEKSNSPGELMSRIVTLRLLSQSDESFSSSWTVRVSRHCSSTVFALSCI